MPMPIGIVAWFVVPCNKLMEVNFETSSKFADNRYDLVKFYDIIQMIK